MNKQGLKNLFNEEIVDPWFDEATRNVLFSFLTKLWSQFSKMILLQTILHNEVTKIKTFIYFGILG